MSSSIEIRPTEIPDVLEIHGKCFPDDRGYFTECYNREVWSRAGFRETFVQDNLSLSKRGVIRGMHFQRIPQGMGKLVRAITGAVFDVAVDLRRGSPTYGRWVGRTLRGDDPMWLWVPVGFAHGFLSLMDDTRVYYKCSGSYSPEAEGALRYNDPAVGIDWPESPTVVTDKDATAPLLAEVESNFVYAG